MNNHGPGKGLLRKLWYFLFEYDVTEKGRFQNMPYMNNQYGPEKDLLLINIYYLCDECI